jgi:uncharacterized membrane protein
MNLETSRMLGVIGAILMFIGVIPYINYFGAVELIGLILVMVALYGLASYYKEGGIFNNALYGLIIGIVGGVVSVAALFITVLTSLTDFLYAVFPDWNGDWTALSGLTPNPSNLSLENIAPFLTGIIAVLVILWVAAIIAAFFIRRSLGALSAKSGVGLFGTTGLLMLIGAILIVIAIGLLLIWIAFILLAVAFFYIRPTAAEPTAPASPSTQ